MFSNSHARHGHAVGALATLVLLAGAVGLGAYPLVRRTTRRIERLQQRLDELGEGDLGARVQVEGRDEVANLAQRFNRAAERIETLVNAQRNTLASASHELRAPLARIRMAVELFGAGSPEALRESVSGDITELDDLIEELLLASRLDGMDARGRWEPESGIDLLALLAEEAARFSVEVEGDPLQIRGDRRMLRRLARNLLENARRYGGGKGASIEVRLESLDGGAARLCVCDRGAGVPESERERIFEPFYRRSGTRDGERRGVGLGLALVRQIAHRHGGRVRCLARPGGGTCFEVILSDIEPATDAV